MLGKPYKLPFIPIPTWSGGYEGPIVQMGTLRQREVRRLALGRMTDDEWSLPDCTAGAAPSVVLSPLSARAAGDIRRKAVLTFWENLVKPVFFN